MLNTEPKPEPNPSTQLIRVAVGVITRAAPLREVLIARRQKGQHLEGLWEFPGGKVEAGESPEQALRRELQEEVGLSVSAFKPLMTIEHQYPGKQVSLEIFLVDSFTGEAAGMEGQTIQWAPASELSQYHFPEANQQIVDYLVKLPE